MRSELSETARLLIRTATAQELKPDAQYRARLLAAVRERALLPGAASSEAAQMAPGVGAPQLVPLTALKVVAAAALGAGLGLGTVGVAQIAVQRSPHQPSAAHAAAPTARAGGGQEQAGRSSRLAASPSEPRPLDGPVAPSQAAFAPAPHPVPGAPPASELSAARLSPSPPEVQTLEEAPSTPSAIALRAELSLLKDVQGALRVGQARRALELVARHEREFPQGQLGHERLAAEVFAACQLGDVARARSASRRFLERDSSSPLALRVKGACGLASDAAGILHD